jgi:hypothetical protein
MGNTVNSVTKQLANFMPGPSGEDYNEEKLPEGDKYFGFVNV